jgi:hypothetical protein
MGSWEFFGKPVDVVEISVRSVFAFLVELTVVKPFIVKPGHGGRSRFGSTESRVRLVSERLNGGVGWD